jgi:hypothetical protein
MGSCCPSKPVGSLRPFLEGKKNKLIELIDKVE